MKFRQLLKDEKLSKSTLSPTVVMASTLLINVSCSNLTPLPKEEKKMVSEGVAREESMPDDVVGYVNKNARGIANLSQYKVIGDCDGHPQVDVKTAPGFCLGLVYNGEGTSVPRGIVQLSEKEFLLSDMGPNWAANAGKLYLLSLDDDQKTSMKVLLDAQSQGLSGALKLSMDRPNQITKDRFDEIYIASAGSISRFHTDKIGTAGMIETVIRDIPTDGIHPLKAIAFDKNNNMYVNVGSKTNVCQDSGAGIFRKPKPCPEAESEGRAAIYKYNYNKDTRSYDPKFSIYAKGLRNSMVLIWDDEQNILLQAENARDALPARSDLDDKLFPHDEMNLIAPNKHYGWPYCFDNNVANPEFKKWDCSPYQKPYLFLPPHAAPLGVIRYTGDLFPDWYKKRYIFSFHGYENAGHRIVTFKRDEKLLPTGDSLSMVYGWDNQGSQAMGTPVGMTEASDGSVYIVEDKSRKVTRLFYDATKGDGKPVKEDLLSAGKITDEEANEILERKIAFNERLKKKDVPVFTQFQAKVIDQSCILCHGGKNAPGIQLLQYDDVGNAKRIIESQKASGLYNRIMGGTNVPMMPPMGFRSESEKNEAVTLFKRWMDTGMPIPK